MSEQALTYLRSRRQQFANSHPGSELVRLVDQLIADIEAEQPAKPKKGKGQPEEDPADE